MSEARTKDVVILPSGGSGYDVDRLRAALSSTAVTSRHAQAVHVTAASWPSGNTRTYQQTPWKR